MNDQRQNSASAFLGRGWAFPVGSEAGEVYTAAYEEDIRQAVRIILGTNPGERVMRPEFGAGLNAFVFEPVNTNTMQTLRIRVEKSLVKWEPRIDVENVAVIPDAAEHNRLYIEISYRVRLTNTQHNMVYPFYLQEGSTS
ncbi:GPW/gp25 family protein [Candidatus Zixiibacteriota bacterium]